MKARSHLSHNEPKKYITTIVSVIVPLRVVQAATKKILARKEWCVG